MDENNEQTRRIATRSSVSREGSMESSRGIVRLCEKVSRHGGGGYIKNTGGRGKGAKGAATVRVCTMVFFVVRLRLSDRPCEHKQKSA